MPGRNNPNTVRMVLLIIYSDLESSQERKQPPQSGINSEGVYEQLNVSYWSKDHRENVVKRIEVSTPSSLFTRVQPCDF
jgi:hypothetical protein